MLVAEQRNSCGDQEKAGDYRDGNGDQTRGDQQEAKRFSKTGRHYDDSA
jgi:hypothetical protein